MKKLVGTRALQKLGATFYTKHYPGCMEFVFDTPGYWNCYIRHITLTSYHPAGTCRMGSVVDEFFKYVSQYRIDKSYVRSALEFHVEHMLSFCSFRVYDTENLYIVDASVLPVLPSGNIHAAVVMCADKAARLLIDRRSQRLSLECDFKDMIEHLFYVRQIKDQCY